MRRRLPCPIHGGNPRCAARGRPPPPTPLCAGGGRTESPRRCRPCGSAPPSGRCRQRSSGGSHTGAAGHNQDDRRFPEQDERCVGDLPFSGLQILGRAQPELVEQDPRIRVGIRIVRHLRLPVPGNGPAVQLGSADFPVNVGRDLPVMIRGERSRQLDLDGLRGGERRVQACALPREAFVPFVHLIRQQDGLGLAVGTESDPVTSKTGTSRPAAPGRPGRSIRRGRTGRGS